MTFPSQHPSSDPFRPASPQGPGQPQWSRTPEYGAPVPQGQQVQQWNAYPPVAAATGGWTPEHRPVPPSTNVLAIVSLVTSLLGMGIVPVICGHISLNQISRTRESGRGLAIAGLVIGYLEVLAYVGFFFLIAVLAASF